MRRMKAAALVGLFLLLGGPAPALEIQELESAGLSRNMAVWGQKALRGSWTSVSAYGLLGAFGVPLSVLGDYRLDPRRFLEDRSGQARLWLARERQTWAVVQRTGLGSAIGRNACYQEVCVEVTASSLLAACRQGCNGPESPTRLWQRRGDCEDPAVAGVCRDLVGYAGYDVKEITGRPE